MSAHNDKSRKRKRGPSVEGSGDQPRIMPAILNTSMPDFVGSPQKKRRPSSAITPSEQRVLPDILNTPTDVGSARRKRRSSTNSLRSMPDILNTSTEFGSPHKFWEGLCEKDEKEQSYYRNPDYMKLHPKIDGKMRYKLYEWLMNVCEDLTLHRETFHLTIDFVDRFLSVEREGFNVVPENLQLIGVTALLLATKVEEVYPPKMAELVSLTDGACTNDQVRIMEEIILTQLQWHCSPVSAVQWLAFYLHLISRQELEPFLQQSNSLAISDSFPSSSESLRMQPRPANAARNVSIGSDSQYESQDPDLFKTSGDFSASFDSSFFATHHTQTRHMRQFSIPKLMRDDFMVLTKVLELCMFDMEYLRFTYSEVAAAIVMLSYEPRDRVESVIGFSYNDLRDAIYFVEPFVRATRANVLPGVVIPNFTGVDSRDQHNIQTGFSDHDKLLANVDKLRVERQKSMETKKDQLRVRRLF